MTSAGNPTDLTPDQLEALLRDPKSGTEFRILRAARRLLARDGLGVSIDDIAAEADLGRRTVFRHFAGRDELVARALSESLSRFHSQVSSVVDPDADLEEWLERIVAVLHGSQRNAGHALWQLAASRDSDLPPPIARVNQQRREARRELSRSVADAAWAKAGGAGRAPTEVELALAMTLSSFAVHSLHFDYEADEHDVTRSVVSMLTAMIRRAVAGTTAG